MAKTAITIEFDPDHLAGYTDSFLAMLWHVGQANPAPHGDKAAGQNAEQIGREIIRRWLGQSQLELWHHQGRDYYAHHLTALATYTPGGPSGTPEWNDGTWTPKAEPPADSSAAAEVLT